MRSPDVGWPVDPDSGARQPPRAFAALRSASFQAGLTLVSALVWPFGTPYRLRLHLAVLPSSF